MNIREKLVYGTYRLPNSFEEFKEMVLFCLNNGVNYIDTAYCYNRGLSEIWLGKLNLNNCKISTKVGKYYLDNGKLDVSLDRNKIYKQVKSSLKRLNVKIVDHIFLHNYEKGKKIEEISKLIEELINKKVTKKIGLSNFPFSIAQKLVKNKLIDTVQLEYKHNLNKEIAFFNSYKVEVWLYRPFLKGKLLKNDQKPENIIKDIHKEYHSCKIVFGATKVDQLLWIKDI